MVERPPELYAKSSSLRITRGGSGSEIGERPSFHNRTQGLRSGPGSFYSRHGTLKSAPEASGAAVTLFKEAAERVTGAVTCFMAAAEGATAAMTCSAAAAEHVTAPVTRSAMASECVTAPVTRSVPASDPSAANVKLSPAVCQLHSAPLRPSSPLRRRTRVGVPAEAVEVDAAAAVEDDPFLFEEMALQTRL
jgi:hypothetical protein